MRRVSFMAALLLAAAGCENDLPLASQIQHMRVLGASTSVAGDPARTTPKPGEKARLTWSMVYPETMTDDSSLRSIFFVCTAPRQFSGTPICQELLDIAQGGSISAILADARNDPPDCGKNPDRTDQLGPFTVVCVSGTPRLDVSIPGDTRAEAKLVRGAICRNGTPKIDDKDPTGMSCDALPGTSKDEQENIAVYGTVPIEYSGSDRNHTPSIDGLQLAFHDPPLAWNAIGPETSASLNDEDCADQSADKQVMHSEGHEELITLMYDDEQRETHDGEKEALEFSGYSTFGKLSRRFTVFGANATAPLRSTLTWDLKTEEREALNGKSKHVRFYFTILDRRGGFALTTRDLCINR